MILSKVLNIIGRKIKISPYFQLSRTAQQVTLTLSLSQCVSHLLISASSGHCRVAILYSAAFSKPNPVFCLEKLHPKNAKIFQTYSCLVWDEIDFARRRFQTKCRLVCKILMTIKNVLNIPNQIQFGLEKSLTLANALNQFQFYIAKSHFRKGKHSNTLFRTLTMVFKISKPI